MVWFELRFFLVQITLLRYTSDVKKFDLRGVDTSQKIRRLVIIACLVILLEAQQRIDLVCRIAYQLNIFAVIWRIMAISRNFFKVIILLR